MGDGEVMFASQQYITTDQQVGGLSTTAGFQSRRNQEQVSITSSEPLQKATPIIHYQYLREKNLDHSQHLFFCCQTTILK